jgi:hypothetical protein
MVSCDGPGFQCGTSASRAKFIGNIMQVAGGQAGVCNTTNADFYYNVEQQFSSEFSNPSLPCGSTDVFQNNLSFYTSQTQGPNFDLHLNTSSSTPYNFVPTNVIGGCSATDIDGQSRPQGVACDAGADEYSGSTGGPSPPTVSLTANPTSITSGSSSTLSWNSTNATSCTASGAWSGSKATSGTQSVSPTSTSTYNLSCTGTGGTANASATVTVGTTSGPPAITSISPTSGPIGTQVTINGSNLDKATIVEFNQGGTVSYTINSPSKITATVPSGSQTGYISINQGQALSPTVFTVTAPTTKVGDLNSDGVVNITDLSILLSSWNTTNSTADINKDGTVNILDLSILLSNYGT